MNLASLKKIITLATAVTICTACGGGGSSGNGNAPTNPAFSYTTLSALPTLATSFYSTSSFGSNMVQGANGNFYFATSLPAAVYQITPTGTVTEFYTVAGANSPSTQSFLLGSDGNFYLMTYGGGNFNGGAIYKIAPNDGTGSAIYSFPAGTAVGMGTLIQGSDGFLYGTTTYGTATIYGSVFKLSTSGVYTTLYSPGSSAQAISAITEGSDGNLYLASSQLEKLTTAGMLTPLGTAPLTIIPNNLLQGKDGNFYGIGNSSVNQAFVQISPSGAETLLYTFTGQGLCAEVDGSGQEACTGPEPMQLLLAADGSFYGSTMYGSSSTAGNLFKLIVTGQETVVYDYGASGDFAPALMQGQDGKLYGVSWPIQGGAPNLFAVGL